MHADRTNRVIMLLFALLLIAAGATAGAASIGAFGTFTRHSFLTANPTGDYIGRQGGWLWPVAAVVALVLVLLALRWLLTLLFSTDRAGDLLLPAGSSPGRTTLAPGALTGAVIGEIESYRGVSSARARLIGDSADPALVVTVALEETADLAALRRRIETEALAHARTAVGGTPMHTQLDLTVTTKRPARVA